MKSIPTVAVITRTKDRPLLLERAIKSVMNQSHKDLLMVIVNDGGEPRVIDGLIKKYDSLKLKVVHNKKPLGMAAATNIGIEKSDSIYIAVLDDDDTWHPDFLKLTIEYLSSNHANGVVTGSEIVYERVTNNRFQTIRKELFLPEQISINLFLLLGKNRFPVNSFVYSRKVVKELGCHDEKAAPVDDWDFNLRLVSRYEVGYISRSLAYYHRRLEAEGGMANSIYAENNRHSEATTYVLNKYLRKDLKEGKLGIGFIANLSNALFEETRSLTESINSSQNNLLLKLQHIEKKLDFIDDKMKSIEAQSEPLEKRLKRYLSRMLGR